METLPYFLLTFFALAAEVKFAINAE